MYEATVFELDAAKLYRSLFLNFVGTARNPLNPGPIICTYAIVNKRTGEAYVGSTTSFWTRWNQHRNRLRFGNHKNVLLQRAFTKYGAEAFTLRILRQYDTTKGLLKREAADALEHFDQTQLYNGRIGMRTCFAYPRQNDLRAPTRQVGRNRPRWFDGQTS